MVFLCGLHDMVKGRGAFQTVANDPHAAQLAVFVRIVVGNSGNGRRAFNRIGAVGLGRGLDKAANSVSLGNGLARMGANGCGDEDGKGQ